MTVGNVPRLNRTLHRSFPSTFLVLLLVAVACHGVIRDEQLESKRMVEEVWGHHDEVVALAIRGHQEGDQFIDAVRFFAQLTGIEIDVNMSTMGLIPTERTAHDLELVRAWFEANRDRLYFDPTTGTVRLLEP